MKHDIFISYSRKNHAVVNLIKTQIDSETGANCWMDTKGIESGSERFEKDIIDGINNCMVFFFMLSAESQKSEYALLELSFAKKRGKRVVIINIDDCQMCDEFEFKYSLTDIISWNSFPQRQKLIKDVKNWIGYTEPITRENDERNYELGKLYKFKNCGKYGFTDESGKLVIPCKFKMVEDFDNPIIGLAVVKDIDGWGVINKKGENIIPCKWGHCTYDNGLFWVMDSKGSKWGAIDINGKSVVPCIYSWIESSKDGLVAVHGDEGYGFIDSSGRIVIPCQYWQIIRPFENGVACVVTYSGECFLIDKTGRRKKL